MATMTKRREIGLGEAIRNRIAENDTTMEQASRELDVPPNAMSRWNTYVEPTPENYAVLMEFLGVSLEELGAMIVRDQLEKWELKQRLSPTSQPRRRGRRPPGAKS